MKNTRTPAEVITATIFDAIPVKRPRASVLGTLLGEKSVQEPVAVQPRYRTLTEARQELEARGVAREVSQYLLTGLSDLIFEAVIEKGQTLEGFDRRKHVTWFDDNAYLGITFKHPDFSGDFSSMPLVVAKIRSRFLSNVSDILEKRAITSLAPEAIDHAARLVPA